MTRTQRSIDRAHDRKMERVQRSAHSAAGPSFQSTMEARLFDACWRYLEMKDTGWGQGDHLLRQQRGVVRGIAGSYMLWIKWYQNTGRGRKIKSTQDQIEYVKRLEKRWMTRTRKVRETKMFDTLPPSRINADGITAKW